MKEKRSYGEVFAKQDPVRIITHVLAAGIVIFLLVRFIMAVSTGFDPNNRTLSYLAVSALYLLPYAYELIFRRRISNFVLLFYVLYVFVAGALCSCLNLYNYVPGFDKIVHGAFGYVGCMVGLLIVCKLSSYEKLNPVFVGIVCFAVSLCCGACWELIEFTGDSLFGQNSQGAYIETVTGELIQSKMDTMLDLLANFIGAIVFELNFLLHKLTRKNLLIGLMVRDFSARPSGADEPAAARGNEGEKSE